MILINSKEIKYRRYCTFITFHGFSKIQHQEYVNFGAMILTVQYTIRNCTSIKNKFHGWTQQNPQKLVLNLMNIDEITASHYKFLSPFSFINGEDFSPFSFINGEDFSHLSLLSLSYSPSSRRCPDLRFWQEYHRFVWLGLVDSGNSYL